MLVLASASPRRRELIALLGLPFEVIPSLYEEPPAPESPIPIATFVTELAANKALETATRDCRSECHYIGADTLVTLSLSDTKPGIPLGKPKDKADASRMLRSLSGRTHFVYTGIALCSYNPIIGSKIIATQCVRTGVTFRELSEEMIEDYVATGEPMDKAGAYGAQGYAAPFITGFEGDFYNVVGLPVSALGLLLEKNGLNWWQSRDIDRMPVVIG